MKRAIYNCTRYLAPRHIIVGMIVHVIAYIQLVPDLKFNVYCCYVDNKIHVQ